MTNAVKKETGFKAAVTAFEKVQSKFADFGAWDTEPDTEFQILIRRLYEGNDPTKDVPTTARGWQLYGDMDGSDVAAKALHAAAVKAIDAGKKDALGLAQYARNELWRA